MLKYWPTDRSHTCSPPDVFSDWTHQTVREGTESNGYRGTGPGERFLSVSTRCSNTGQPTAPTRVARQMRSRIGRT